MADTVTMKAPARGYRAVRKPTGLELGSQHAEVTVTSFFGGQERGRMIQVTVGHEYVCLTQAEARNLAHLVGFGAEFGISSLPRVLPE